MGPPPPPPPPRQRVGCVKPRVWIDSVPHGERRPRSFIASVLCARVRSVRQAERWIASSRAVDRSRSRQHRRGPVACSAVWPQRIGSTEIASAKCGLEVWSAFCPPSSAPIEAPHATYFVPHLHEAGLTRFRAATDELTTMCDGVAQ